MRQTHDKNLQDLNNFPWSNLQKLITGQVMKDFLLNWLDSVGEGVLSDGKTIEVAITELRDRIANITPGDPGGDPDNSKCQGLAFGGDPAPEGKSLGDWYVYMGEGPLTWTGPAKEKPGIVYLTVDGSNQQIWATVPFGTDEKYSDQFQKIDDVVHLNLQYISANADTLMEMSDLYFAYFNFIPSVINNREVELVWDNSQGGVEGSWWMFSHVSALELSDQKTITFQMKVNHSSFIRLTSFPGLFQDTYTSNLPSTGGGETYSEETPGVWVDVTCVVRSNQAFDGYRIGTEYIERLEGVSINIRNIKVQNS